LSMKINQYLKNVKYTLNFRVNIPSLTVREQMKLGNPCVSMGSELLSVLKSE